MFLKPLQPITIKITIMFELARFLMVERNARLYDNTHNNKYVLKKIEKVLKSLEGFTTCTVPQLRLSLKNTRKTHCRKKVRFASPFHFDDMFKASINARSQS